PAPEPALHGALHLHVARHVEERPRLRLDLLAPAQRDDHRLHDVAHDVELAGTMVPVRHRRRAAGGAEARPFRQRLPAALAIHRSAPRVRVARMPASEIAKIFQGLPKKFQKGNVKKARTYYFSLDDDEKWTVSIAPDRCDVKAGKPAEDAD